MRQVQRGATRYRATATTIVAVAITMVMSAPARALDAQAAGSRQAPRSTTGAEAGGAVRVDSITAGYRFPARAAIRPGKVAGDAEMTRDGATRSGARSVLTISAGGSTGDATYIFRTEPQGQSADWYETVVRRDDFAPLRFAMRTARDSASVTIAGDRVEGWRDGPTHGRERIAERLAARPFDAMLHEHVLTLLPLREGYEAAIYTYHPFLGAKWQRYRVTGADSVRAGTGTARAWRVVRVGEPDDMAEITLWIDRDASRLLEKRLALRNGTVITTRFSPLA